MLSLLGRIYGKIADLRNKLYDAGVFESADLRARTISIGNITAGGTGKTPLVAYVAEVLARRGERVCILTRGYGRANPGKRVVVSDGNEILADPMNAGDEPYELAQRLLVKARVIADADRRSAAEWAIRKFNVTAFVLDDGFQHRKVKRDVDIVCIDATDPLGSSHMLPAGRLREPLTNLSRADIIVITRSDLVENIDTIRSEVRAYSTDAPIFAARSEIVNVIELEKFNSGDDKGTFSGDWIEVGLAVGAFCALGNPESFFTELRAGFSRAAPAVDLVLNRQFRDHHIYTQSHIDSVEKEARNAGVNALVTTAKDAVKLQNLNFTLPCYVVVIETVIDDAAAFDELL